MLKSTFRQAPPLPSPAPLPPAIEPLPSGWTEHQAPSGVAYYYHADTGQSTYTRPRAIQPPNAFVQSHNGAIPTQADFVSLGDISSTYHEPQRRDSFGQQQQRTRSLRWQSSDRPKTKFELRDCRPWLLVKTKLGRRFVHNPETGESFWKFPEHVAKAVVQFDVENAKRVGRRERGEASPEHRPSQEPVRDEASIQDNGKLSGFTDESIAPTADAKPTQDRIHKPPHEPEEEEEFDEIIEEEEEELDDDDDDDGVEDDPNEGAPSKRPRTDIQQNSLENQGVEFDEDDMEWQLEQMGQAYELEAGEYGADDEDYNEDVHGLQLTDDDATALFEDLLEHHNISPFATWDGVIDEGIIVEDDRYTVLTSMKARREAFAAWSARKADELREARAKQSKHNPRIPYLDLLQKHATPKLYWPEFKRKFKKEPEMKDHKITDKDREKMYREYISRTTKMSESDLRHDLDALLRSIPPSQQWHNGVSIEGELPEALLADVRFVSLESRLRAQVVSDFIATLPDAEELDDAETSAARAQRKADRAKRDKALQERSRQIGDDKRRYERDLRQGRRLLEESEE